MKIGSTFFIRTLPKFQPTKEAYHGNVAVGEEKRWPHIKSQEEVGERVPTKPMPNCQFTNSTALLCFFLFLDGFFSKPK